ncbi:MAG: methyltransferase domain-containing protein [Acidobacteriota bacterium]|nr:methyltransferase domain-containing protein [Acidobacteriota bacterium]
MNRLTPSKEETGDLSNPGRLPQPGKAQRPPFRLSDLWKAPLHDLPIRDEILYQYLPLSPEMEVLEVGPGSGFTAFRLSRRVKHITVLDIAPGTIETLKVTFKDLANVDYWCASLSEPDLCPAAGRAFDAAYALEVFEYVSDPAVCLKNLASLLKPEGMLLLNWPNYDTSRTNGVNYIRNLKDIDMMMEQAGFASWDIYALRLRPYTRLIFRNLHEWPLNLYRRLRSSSEGKGALTFDQTWHYQNNMRLGRYRFAVHSAWALVFAGLRIGGHCFERFPLKDGSADGNLLLLAQR